MKTETGIMQDYEKQVLMGYADSFRDLADSLMEGEKREIRTDDRRFLLLAGQVRQQRRLFSGQVRRLSEVMREIADKTGQMERISEKKLRQVQRELKGEKLLVEDLFFLRDEKDSKRECLVRMKTLGRRNITIDEAAGYLSVCLNIRLVAERNTPFFIGTEFFGYLFCEEPSFHVLSGVATAIKETEKVSGDYQESFEYGEGKMAFLLSDGMGSGEEAREESIRATGLFRQFLQAGFSTEDSAQMVNANLMCGEEKEHTSTLDCCTIDLYRGICHFCKVGGAVTYIKRDTMVEPVSSRNLPLGAVEGVESETVNRVLEDGDYIIMVTDGIIDALNQGVGEAALAEVIGRFQTRNPEELANDLLKYALHQCGGKVRDDMTVMVIGFWNAFD